jgi:hypothetical protein
MITGLGQPADTVYHEFGRRLAERGYVVFAPLILHHHPPQQINDQARAADAAGMMRVAMVIAKTQRAVDFLETLPFVDRRRIGYYGLSYGGYSTLWVSPLVDRLAAIVISGHFNDWRSKITSDATPTSYLRHPDEDFYNWNVLPRFTHPELVTMMLPRPVAVEFGQQDGITTPAWTAYAWGQLSAIAAHLGMAGRVVLAHYDGVHEIHGVETFAFLDHLLRPELPAGQDLPEKAPAPGSPPAWAEFVVGSRAGDFGRGRFWMPQGARTLRGLALRVARVGHPGPLEIRWGSAPGGDNLGCARLPAERIADTPAPVVLAGEPRPVGEGTLVYYRLSAAPGAASGYYRVLGPRPLGGTEMPGFVAPFYRVLTDRPQDTLR